MSSALTTQRKKKKLHVPRSCFIDSNEKKLNKIEYWKNSQMCIIEDCKIWQSNQQNFTDIQPSLTYFKYQNYIQLIHIKFIGKVN